MWWLHSSSLYILWYGYTLNIKVFFFFLKEAKKLMHPVTLVISLTLTQVQPFQTCIKEIKNEESSYQYKDSFKEAKNL